MATQRQVRVLMEVQRELDLVVYQLERDPPSEAAAAVDQRKRMRRELERLRDQLGDLVRELE